MCHRNFTRILFVHKENKSNDFIQQFVTAAPRGYPCGAVYAPCNVILSKTDDVGSVARLDGQYPAQKLTKTVQNFNCQNNVIECK